MKVLANVARMTRSRTRPSTLTGRPGRPAEGRGRNTRPTTWRNEHALPTDTDQYPSVAAQRPVTSAYREPLREQLRSEEHTSELQSFRHLVCRLLLEKKKTH